MIVHGYSPWGKALTDIKRRDAAKTTEVELRFPAASGKPVKGVPIAGIEAIDPMAAAMTLRGAKLVQTKIAQAGHLYKAALNLIATMTIDGNDNQIVDDAAFDQLVAAMKGCQDE